MKESIRKKIVSEMAMRLDDVIEHGTFELAKLHGEGPLFLCGSNPYSVRELEEIKELVVLEFFDDVYRLDRVLAAMLSFVSNGKYQVTELFGLRTVGTIVTPIGVINISKMKFI